MPHGGTSLLQWQRSLDSKLTSSSVVIAIEQILKGVQYLQSKNTVHLDLYKSNILVNKDGTLRICDFGEAKVLEENQDLKATGGCQSYLPPEMILSRKVKPTLGHLESSYLRWHSAKTSPFLR